MGKRNENVLNTLNFAFIISIKYKPKITSYKLSKGSPEINPYKGNSSCYLTKL